MPDLPDPLLRRRQRVRRVSVFLKVVSALTMLNLVVAVVMAWILPIVVIGPTYGTRAQPAVAQRSDTIDGLQRNRPYLELAGRRPHVGIFSETVISQNVSRLRPNRELLARAVTALYWAFLVLGCWMFYRLFQTYERGHILTAESAQRLKRVGFWMIGWWGCEILFQLSKPWWEILPSMQFHLGPGLFPGLFVCLIAWIMEEAHLVAEEQELTV